MVGQLLSHGAREWPSTDIGRVPGNGISLAWLLPQVLYICMYLPANHINAVCARAWPEARRFGFFLSLSRSRSRSRSRFRLFLFLRVITFAAAYRVLWVTYPVVVFWVMSIRQTGGQTHRKRETVIWYGQEVRRESILIARSARVVTPSALKNQKEASGASKTKI